jgi:hypothetical protein
MRPFGHDNVREGRDVGTVDTLPELRAAWLRYRSHFYGSYDRSFAFAQETLDPVRPSIVDLHRFIISENTRSDTLGLFISAGYALAPERRIVYDLDTPTLDLLGYGLRGKELVITGTLGMDAGRAMIGTIVNKGKLGKGAGSGMIGTFINEEEDSPRPCIQVGVYRHSGGKRIGNFTLGDNNGQWNVDASLRDDFLQDITDPRDMSNYAFRAYLIRTYSASWRRRR